MDNRPEGKTLADELEQGRSGKSSAVNLRAV
jgi:hypothetical protein